MQRYTVSIQPLSWISVVCVMEMEVTRMSVVYALDEIMIWIYVEYASAIIWI